MKNIAPTLTRQDAQELVQRKRQEFRLIGSVKRIPGLILFEYDLTTGVLRRATMKKEVELNIDGRIGAKARVDSRDFCLYIQALNEENAMRKVRQMLKRKSTRENLFKHR